MTMLVEVEGWAGALERLVAGLASRFCREAGVRRVLSYLRGLLAPLERKNGWQLAEAAGDVSPAAMQDFLSRTRWDADAVRDDLREYVVERLGDPSGVLVLTEVGFPKKGAKSAGVERLRNSTTGRLENRQLGLFLAYASPRGWACIDRALYLPEEWAEDEARRREAGVPEEVTFATKGELARRMLERAFDASVPAAWVTGGETYGTDRRLRHWLEARGYSYVLAEERSATLPRPEGTLLPSVPGWAGFVIEGGAERSSEGNRGPRRQQSDVGLTEFLLVCGAVGPTDEYISHRAYGPRQTPLLRMGRVASRLWTIEEGLERAKDEVGLDQYEVRRWDAWHHHITLSLVAHAALQVARARAASSGDRRSPA
jgi:SRSO17 transposase